MLNWFSSMILCGGVTMTIFLWIYSFKRVRNRLKRFFQIQFRQRILDRAIRGSDHDGFAEYYRTFLCHFQETNNKLLGEILEKNHRCQFHIDRSIDKNDSIDEFRNKVRLTTYDDYRSYIDRMVNDGEEKLLCSEENIYYATSSGTTANIKLLPVIKQEAMNIRQIYRLSQTLIWRSLPSNVFPLPSQRTFQINTAKTRDRFLKSKNGTLMGPLSQFNSIVPMSPILRLITASMNVVSNDLIDDIVDFETSCFVQFVFALAHDDLYSCSANFAPSLLHSIEMIKIYFREMCQCIVTGNFNRSSLVQKNIEKKKMRERLNDRLKELLDEYGGEIYQNRRAEYIYRQCEQNDQSALLDRLWPKLIFVSVGIGGSFASYKEDVRFYCGERIQLINMMFYVSSEGFFGCLASIHTDEYILLPTFCFYEFIREEDVDQSQPKTLLMSEIEVGHSYELVCTTRAGLIRYRMGDIVRCTRFLQRTDDLVPLPDEPKDVPRIPLISVGYRIGTLLSVFGEKTSEKHIFNAIEQTIEHWKKENFQFDWIDFTSYAKLNVFPVRYVIFVELTDENLEKNFAEKFTEQLEKELCRSNENYQNNRRAKQLDHLQCLLVRRGTFENFVHRILLNDRVSATQVKPHRLLRKDEFIQYFYDQQIE